jgi:hypothetical protein
MYLSPSDSTLHEKASLYKLKINKLTRKEEETRYPSRYRLCVSVDGTWTKQGHMSMYGIPSVTSKYTILGIHMSKYVMNVQQGRDYDSSDRQNWEELTQDFLY